MSFESSAGPERADATRQRGGRSRSFAAALRSTAASAADAGGGGVALLFVTEPDDGMESTPPQLRAAAGFALAQAAREAAGALRGAVHQAIEQGETVDVGPLAALGERATGELRVHPLCFEDRIHGALAVGSPSALGPQAAAAIEELVESAAIRLDHAWLCDEIGARSGRPGSAEDAAPDGSEEVLKLSEALFAQDIELLRSNEKLGKIEKLKNDFIEKMSRELRTPLNSIIEAIIAVLTGENDALSEPGKDSLRAALDDGTAFLRTLQNILDLWRIKQGELPVEVQEVNFRELVDEAVFSIQDSLGGKRLSVEKRLQEPFPKLRTDLAKLNQILFLLLDNAVKFTPEGQVEIEARVERGRLICQVRDTGIGVCPDDQQFIFDEFFQVDEPSSQKYSGAGLGLALLRDLVVLLEGEVSVVSDAGRGTTVTFELPVEILS